MLLSKSAPRLSQGSYAALIRRPTTSAPAEAPEESQSTDGRDQKKRHCTGFLSKELNKLKNKIQFASFHLVGNHFPLH